MPRSRVDALPAVACPGGEGVVAYGPPLLEHESGKARRRGKNDSRDGRSPSRFSSADRFGAHQRCGGDRRVPLVTAAAELAVVAAAVVL